MAREPAAKGDSGKSREESEEDTFENRPSDLDDLTHQELRLMYDRASEAVLFAKNIQWRSVGSSLVVMAAFITLATFGRACEYSRRFDNRIGRRGDVRSNPLPVLAVQRDFPHRRDREVFLDLVSQDSRYQVAP